MQIRTMEKQKPPVRIIVPGKVYRRDNPDATHGYMFHQIEGLAVDTDITFCDFKGTVEYFVREFLGPKAKTRLRPSYFPFTEPSAEVDATCHVCGGSGCRVCKFSGWIELFGAGMVNPAVYGFVNYDPEKLSGFAFGMGVDRLAMMKYGDQRIAGAHAERRALPAAVPVMTATSDSKERFSNRVADYVRYRPGYPRGVLELLRDECGLMPESVDRGCRLGHGNSDAAVSRKRKLRVRRRAECGDARSGSRSSSPRIRNSAACGCGRSDHAAGRECRFRGGRAGLSLVRSRRRRARSLQRILRPAGLGGA